MSDPDEILRKRLEKLRADGDSLPKPSSSGVLPKTVKKSAPEQIEDLLAQLAGEASLQQKERDRQLDIDSQLRNRLERLKSRENCEFISFKKESTSSKSSVVDDLEDEEFFKKSTCSDLLVGLENTSDSDSFSDESRDSDILCAVCDEKPPAIICLDCGKDYFCNKCYKEYHSDDEEHKTMPYIKKP